MSGVTEQQASSMWCPLVRITALPKSFENEVVSTRNVVTKPAAIQAVCIGSKCMAWRWNSQDKSIDSGGYCGLAGAP